MKSKSSVSKLNHQTIATERQTFMNEFKSKSEKKK